MSRISQDLAGQIAFKLTQKSRTAAELLHKEYRQLVEDAYNAQVPKMVTDTFAKHPEWFNTRTRVDFSGHGFRWEQVQTSNAVICNGGQNANLELTDKLATQLFKAKEKWRKADEAVKELQKETDQALINLRTFKNIRENIPEAAPFLPPPMSNSLVVNVDSLNRKLARQPDVKKEEKASK